MWLVSMVLSAGCIALAAMIALARNGKKANRGKISLFNALVAGVFLATVFLFLPVHGAADGGLLQFWRALLLSAFNAIQVFAAGCEFGVVTDGMAQCPAWLSGSYQTWAATLFVLAPIFTFGFILSLFKNLSAYLKYLWVYFKDVYVFSELNDKSLALAGDILCNHKKAAVVFTDVFEDSGEESYEMVENAKQLGAICFKKDVLVIDFHRHAPGKAITFFAISDNETENLNQSLKLIESYRNRANTHIYVFSTKIESELLLTAVDKGNVKVRRINQVQSLINRVLYESGELLFQSANPSSDGVKDICAVVVGMGRHGTEMTKALAWFGQMDGYRIGIHAFDKDSLAEEKFTALAPELMSPDYNGVAVEGEAQYTITVHSDMDVETAGFARTVQGLRNASYVLVALGDDDININTAVNLRMLFERSGIHPVIQAIVYNTQQKNALSGIRNYRGQAYDIDFIGDMEACFTENVIMDSDLEADALQRHLKWGKEEEFWTYEYNYRSSVASAIHMRARIQCGIPGAAKKEEDLTPEERDTIEVLEHRRWNAYMRSEGYVFSGSTDRSSRNDLAKMHHDLVDFSSLTEEEKRKDSSVGTK